MHDACSDDFWTVFLPLHRFSRVCIDAALSATVEAFGDKTDVDNFPKEKRYLIQRINKVPSFWPLVTCSATLDLSSRDLPTRLQQLTFTFIDPVWAWIVAADRQPPGDMHWVPKRKIHPDDPHDFYYGEGVEFGEAFAQAYRTCPSGTYPMLTKLSWDGAHAFGLWATPICIGVGNTNSESADTKYCIGYMPTLNDMGAQYEGKSVELKHFIRQQCVAAVLQVLERAACTGVRCTLKKPSGEPAYMTLMPRLIAMNLDSPDARMYFGLLNKCCCSKCNRRKGRSAFKVGRCQKGSIVQCLYGIVEHCKDAEMVKLASQKLQRWVCIRPLRRYVINTHNVYDTYLN